jgi:hypothetical protein
LEETVKKIGQAAAFGFLGQTMGVHKCHKRPFTKCSQLVRLSSVASIIFEPPAQSDIAEGLKEIP